MYEKIIFIKTFYMKKWILPLLFSAVAFVAKAQPCVPGTLTKPQAGYILPDSATNFNHACVGMYYEQIVYIKAPKDTNMGGIPATIDSFVVSKDVVGLPPGLIAEAVPGYTPAAPPNPKTNFDRLIIKGDSMACIRISGTVPVGTTPMLYNLVIGVRAYVKVSGIVPMDTTANVSYYKIDVKAAPCWPAAVSDLTSVGFELEANTPNPFSNFTSLSFNSRTDEKFSLKVHNLLGQEIYSTEIKGQRGANHVTIDASTWSNGTYVYSVSNGRNSRMGKMQVSK